MLLQLRKRKTLVSRYWKPCLAGSTAATLAMVLHLSESKAHCNSQAHISLEKHWQGVPEFKRPREMPLLTGTDPCPRLSSFMDMEKCWASTWSIVNSSTIITKHFKFWDIGLTSIEQNLEYKIYSYPVLQGVRACDSYIMVLRASGMQASWGRKIFPASLSFGILFNCILWVPRNKSSLYETHSFHNTDHATHATVQHNAARQSCKWKM